MQHEKLRDEILEQVQCDSLSYGWLVQMTRLAYSESDFETRTELLVQSLCDLCEQGLIDVGPTERLSKEEPPCPPRPLDDRFKEYWAKHNHLYRYRVVPWTYSATELADRLRKFIARAGEQPDDIGDQFGFWVARRQASNDSAGRELQLQPNAINDRKVKVPRVMVHVETNAEGLQAAFPDTIKLPDAIRKFHEWFDANGMPVSGQLFPIPHDDDDIEWHSGGKRTLGRLGVVLGEDDGSRYCIWQSDDGRQPIVFLPAAGGEACVLAENAVEFLRLVAIGYEDTWNEVYRGEVFAHPPETDDWIHTRFQDWVSETFDVTIPEAGAVIVRTAQAAFPDFAEWWKEHNDL